MLLSNAAGDELAILGTEIEHQIVRGWYVSWVLLPIKGSYRWIGFLHGLGN